MKNRWGGCFLVSVAKVAEALKGIDFPADKKQCIDYAPNAYGIGRSGRRDEKMPEREYHDMSDIFKAVGQVEPVHQGKPF